MGFKLSDIGFKVSDLGLGSWRSSEFEARSLGSALGIRFLQPIRPLQGTQAANINGLAFSVPAHSPKFLDHQTQCPENPQPLNPEPSNQPKPKTLTTLGPRP